MLSSTASQPGTIRKVHLIAIGGTGMGSLAGLLVEKGYSVTGSDEGLYPPMSTILERLAIPIHTGYRPEHIDPDVDLVIVGNAVARENLEVQEVLRRGVRYTSFPAALAELFLAGRHCVVVAGTHGKTTIASLTAWLLEAGGLDPGLLVGGYPRNFEGGFRIGAGAPFVIEGDEYDTAFFDKGPKFLHYLPRTGILSCIEYDHADIYPSLDKIVDAFGAFAELIPSDGLLIVPADDANVDRVVPRARCRVLRTSIGSEADLWSPEPRLGPEGSELEVIEHGISLGSFRVPLPGRHNAGNALKAIAAARHFGLSPDAIASGLGRFEGVKRRMETIAVAGGVELVDDFAHHPTAIRETVHALRSRSPGRRIWVVFEPRSATSRRNVFQEELAAALAEADEAVVAALFKPDKIPPEKRLDPERLARDAAAKGRPAHYIPDAESIARFVAERAKPGDVVAILTSGGGSGLHDRLEAALRARESQAEEG